MASLFSANFRADVLAVLTAHGFAVAEDEAFIRATSRGGTTLFFRIDESEIAFPRLALLALPEPLALELAKFDLATLAAWLQLAGQ